MKVQGGALLVVVGDELRDREVLASAFDVFFVHLAELAAFKARLSC